MRKHYSAQFKAQLVQQMLREEKTFAQLSSDHGVHPSQLREWRRTAVEGLPSLFAARETTVTLLATHEQQVTDLYAEIGRLTTELSWLKKKAAMSLTRAARQALVERQSPELPLTRQADLLSLSRSSLYYQPVPPSAEEVALKHHIDRLYTACPFYGSRRIAAVRYHPIWA